MSTLQDARAKVRSWLFDDALPLWATQGVDADALTRAGVEIHSADETYQQRGVFEGAGDSRPVIWPHHDLPNNRRQIGSFGCSIGSIGPRK